MTAEHARSSLKAEYTLDNAWHAARQRLSLLEAIQDPKTIAHLERIGVADGWRCLEVGGGGGSIAEWLCRRVGPSGHVVATDISTRFLAALDHPNLEVRQHNIAIDALEEEAFDLVHARAVLLHLSDRMEALGRMIAALRPGGWLLVEEPDYGSKAADPDNDAEALAVFNSVRSRTERALTGAGIDMYFGRRLYGAVRRRGLSNVLAEGWVAMAHGGGPEAQLLQVSIEQQRERFLATGVTADELEAYQAVLGNPAFAWMEMTMVAVWGQKPSV